MVDSTAIAWAVDPRVAVTAGSSLTSAGCDALVATGSIGRDYDPKRALLCLSLVIELARGDQLLRDAGAGPREAHKGAPDDLLEFHLYFIEDVGHQRERGAGVVAVGVPAID